MSPNTRKQKSRVVQQIMDSVNETAVPEISVNDRVSIMTTILNKLGLRNEFTKPTQPTKAGRKLMPIETRMKGWEFWHDNLTQSTLSFRPAKLLLKNKPKIQTSLDFKESLIQKTKRGNSFYVSKWQTAEQSYVELHVSYNLVNPKRTELWYILCSQAILHQRRDNI